MTISDPEPHRSSSGPVRTFVEALGELTFADFATWYTIASLVLIAIARMGHLWPSPIDIDSLLIFPVDAGLFVPTIKRFIGLRRQRRHAPPPG